MIRKFDPLLDRPVSSAQSPIRPRPVPGRVRLYDHTSDTKKTKLAATHAAIITYTLDLSRQPC